MNSDNNNSYNIQPIVRIDTVVQIDTVSKVLTVSKPYPVSVYKTNIDTVRYIDSAYCRELAMKHYSQKVYIDTLYNDSTALIVVNDTVWKNELGKRKLNFQQRIKTVTVSKAIDQTPKYKLFGGLDISCKSITPSIGLERKNAMYKLGYDMVYKTPVAGVYFKIF